MKRGDVTFENEYSQGRLARVITDDGGVFAEYGYDDRGRIEHLNSSRGSLKRSYDGRGRIEQIENDGLAWEVLEHSQAGRPEQIRTPYGVVTMSYDDAAGASPGPR